MFLETIDQNLSLNCENCEQNNGNQGKVHKPLNIRNSVEKAKFQNVFLIWKQTLDEPSHFTTHNHVRWLHWSETEQKTSWVYSSSPTKVGRNKKRKSSQENNRTEDLKRKLPFQSDQNQ